MILNMMVKKSNPIKTPLNLKENGTRGEENNYETKNLYLKVAAEREFSISIRVILGPDNHLKKTKIYLKSEQKFSAVWVNLKIEY